MSAALAITQSSETIYTNGLKQTHTPPAANDNMPLGCNDVKGASPSGQPYRYTGRRLDAQTGLYYYRARYYDPKTAKFLQTDPIGYEDQMNLYNYVNNDPVNATDPSGEAAVLAACVGPQAVGCAVVIGGAAIAVGLWYTGKKAIDAIDDAVNPQTTISLAPGPVSVSTPIVGSGPTSVSTPIGSQGPSSVSTPIAGQGPTSVSTPIQSQGPIIVTSNKPTSHGQQRRGEAAQGDINRQIGGPNRTVQQGRQFLDTTTENTVYVRGNKVVVTDANGRQVTQFKNSRRNTQQRIKDGRWEPVKSE